jgi:uncharacterized membrane protein
MNTYIAVVFSSDDKAHQALRKLWALDDEGELTVHGAAIVRRDDMGHIRVAASQTDFGTRTAIGVGIGALLGLIAGPVGLVSAAAMSIAAATGVGALAGGAIGATADIVKETHRENAAEEAFFTLQHGQSAVVAEISEDWTRVLDDAMRALGGTIYRRENNAATNAAFGDSYYGSYLYPYYYEPMYA